MFSSATLNAMSYAINKNFYNYNLIYAYGKIYRGDLRKLKNAYSRVPHNKQTIVVFNSGGGELQEGLKIGRFLKRHRIGAAVLKNGMCASSCALAFLGGRDLYGRKLMILPYGSKLGFHNFYYKDRSYVRTSVIEKDFGSIISYANEVNAPTSILAKMFNTKFTSMHWVNAHERKILGLKRGLPKVKLAINKKVINKNSYYFTQKQYVKNYLNKMNKIIQANRGIYFNNETAYNDAGYQSWLISNLKYIYVKSIKLVRTNKVVAKVIYTFRNGQRFCSKNNYYLTKNRYGWKIYAKTHKPCSRRYRHLLNKYASILP